MIRAEKIEKSYNNEKVLKGVSLEIRDGEFVSIMGESGSGKSTLLSILSGNDRPDSGEVTFDGFDIEKIAAYGEDKAAELMNNKGIIRNRRKIAASIENCRILKTIVCNFGSFGNYIRSFTNDEIIYETDKTTNSLSDRISSDLIARGMKFVGSTIIYSFLQAIGIIYSHDKDCYLYKG